MRDPLLDGYHAGLRGDDPRLCPHEKGTTEWGRWQMWHGWGTEIGHAGRAAGLFDKDEGQGT